MDEVRIAALKLAMEWMDKREVGYINPVSKEVKGAVAVEEIAGAIVKAAGIFENYLRGGKRAEKAGNF